MGTGFHSLAVHSSANSGKLKPVRAGIFVVKPPLNGTKPRQGRHRPARREYAAPTELGKIFVVADFYKAATPTVLRNAGFQIGGGSEQLRVGQA